MYFVEEGHRCLDPMENYKIVKIISKKNERKLREESEKRRKQWSVNKT